MKPAFLSFTDRGQALAQRLSEALGGTVWRCNAPLNLRDWTSQRFQDSQALVYVGAVGIAVRAIAPHLESKTKDPAVVAVDERGNYAIPLASGHLGGANDLARRIAKLCGGVAVITTATDVNGVFSVDAWARHQNCRVCNPEGIKAVASKCLAGETVSLSRDWPVKGVPPEGVCLTGAADAMVRLSLRREDRQGILRLVPRILVLGVGCRRGTTAGTLERVLGELVEARGIEPQGIYAGASIDLKKDEGGLVEFCAAHGWPLETFSAQALRAVTGDFTASPFVEQVTGVDNVCERSAVLGGGGTLVEKKYAAQGVTLALAARPYTPDWRWTDE